MITPLEEKVGKWLTDKMVRFEFQSSILGVQFNFTIPDKDLILRIKEGYKQISGEDVIISEQLKGQGYDVVNLWEEDIDRRLNLTMTNALEGKEI